MLDKADRIAHLDRLLQNLAGREQKIILLEVANETWQNGLPGLQGILDLREFASYLGSRKSKGSEFVTLPIGILAGGVELQARRPVSFRLYNPMTGAIEQELRNQVGVRFLLPQRPGAYVIRGQFMEMVDEHGSAGADHQRPWGVTARDSELAGDINGRMPFLAKPGSFFRTLLLSCPDSLTTSALWKGFITIKKYAGGRKSI